MSRTTLEANPTFEDYYDILQLSPKADEDTISRVYRILVKRYHPDNQDTADTAKFTQVMQAYRVLSDPEKRAAYDVLYDENRASALRIFKDASEPDGYDGDRRIFEGILSLLYVSRRRDADRGGMGIMQMEEMLSCPSKHLEFHLWYLRQKGWIERLENGLVAITATGVDRVMEQESMFLRRDRLIPDRALSGPRELPGH